MEPTVEVTRYQVSCLPAHHPDAVHFTLTVERRDINPDRWAVLRSGFCYDAKGREKYEPLPSFRPAAQTRSNGGTGTASTRHWRSRKGSHPR